MTYVLRRLVKDKLGIKKMEHKYMYWTRDTDGSYFWQDNIMIAIQYDTKDDALATARMFYQAFWVEYSTARIDPTTRSA